MVAPAAVSELRRLLIVEDSPFDRELYSQLLSELLPDTAVITAEDIASAQRVLHDPEGLDGVLLDNMLPDGKGSALITQIHGRYPHIPVIMLTGDDDEYTALSCLKLGADDYLIKGEITPKTLSRSLRYACERRRVLYQREELQIALVKEQRLNQAHQSFISLVAHEFKTPLGIISAAVQLLKASLPESVLLVRQSEKMLTAITRLNRLMNDVLLMRSAQGSSAGEVLTFSVSEAIKTVCARLERCANERIELYDASTSTMLLGRAQMFHYVLENILKNALSYSPETSQVSVHCAEKHGYAQLLVSDQGSGFSPEMLEKIGKPFQRGEGAFSTPGIGLGLFIVAEFVQQHRGRFYLCSEEHRGTTVCIEWPLAKEQKIMLCADETLQTKATA